MIDTSLFPYQSFNVRLEHKDEKKICWFKDEYHVKKYIKINNLKSKEITIQYRDEKPPKISKADKKNLQQTVEKDDRGSSSTNRRNTKNLDTSRVACSTDKPTKK